MDKISERLSKIRDYLGISQADMAKNMGIGARTYARYENGERDIPAQPLSRIAQMGDINYNWVITGKGNMFIEVKPSSNLTLIDEPEVHLPFYPNTYAAAGYGADNGDEALSVMSFSENFLRMQLGINSFTGLHIIASIGDSMIPTLISGELLFVLPFSSEDNLIQDNGIYVIQTPNGTMVKRIEVHPISRSYVLRSDNSRIDPIKLEGDEIDACKIIGRVVAHFDRV